MSCLKRHCLYVSCLYCQIWLPPLTGLNLGNGYCNSLEMLNKSKETETVNLKSRNSFLIIFYSCVQVKYDKAVFISVAIKLIKIDHVIFTCFERV